MSIISDGKQRILINASQPEETRIALVSEEKGKQHLYDVEYERKGYKQRLGNLYCGRITRIESHLEAVFFDFGGNRQGFLPNREIDPNYYNKKGTLEVGQKMLVQIKKEERGNKGAAISSFISLAGSFMVLMPNNPRAGGISRRIEGEERHELRDILSQLNVPENMGIIIRTAGIGRSQEDLQWDLNILLKQWKAIEKAYKSSEGPTLIYEESDLTIRTIRDQLRHKIDEIWVDQADVHKRVKNYLQQIRPDYVNRLKLFKRQTSLFTHYQIESQIETAFQRNVVLPSGGAIVIDHTEALTTIDINSARATSGSDIEETALNTNLEAVEEAARQLRLRDIGGLVVIDLIDMSSVSNRQKVEQHLSDILQKRDPARIQVGRISRFGLLEMSRQRLRPTLGESGQELCPRCMGEGHIRGVEPLALAIMRLLNEHALSDDNIELRAFVPTAVASYLMNEKRSTIATIEKNCDVKIVIVPTQQIETPHYKIECITEDSLSVDETRPSYQLTYSSTTTTSRRQDPNIIEETPVVANLLTQEPESSVSIVKRFWQSVFGPEDDEEIIATPHVSKTTTQQERKPHSKSKSRNKTSSDHTNKTQSRSRSSTNRSSSSRTATATGRTNKEKNTRKRNTKTSSSTNNSNAVQNSKQSSSTVDASHNSTAKDLAATSTVDTTKDTVKNTTSTKPTRRRSRSTRSTHTRTPSKMSAATTETAIIAKETATTAKEEAKQEKAVQETEASVSTATTTHQTMNSNKNEQSTTRSRRQTRRRRTTKKPTTVATSNETATTSSQANQPSSSKALEATEEQATAQNQTAPTTSEQAVKTTLQEIVQETSANKPRTNRRRNRSVRVQKGPKTRA